MSLHKVKKLVGFDVYQHNYEPSNITNYFSWITNYLDNDISDSNFEITDDNTKIEMNVFYLDKVIKLIIKISPSNSISFELNNNELENIINQIKCKTKNLYEFLITFSGYLNANNPMHKNNDMIEQSEKTEESNNNSNDSDIYESDSDYDSENWNPYEDFQKNKIDSDFLSMISRIRTNALNKYVDDGFSPGKLDISPDFIINVIIKEIEDINKNCDYIKIVPIKDNMFNIDIHFYKFDNENLTDNLDRLNIESIIMNIKLNHNLYPYYPPQVSFKTKLDNKLDIAIINLNYFNPDSWNPTNTMKQLVTGVHKILNNNCEMSSQNSNKYPIINSIIQNILSFNSILPPCLKNFDINIDYVKLNTAKSEDNNDSKHWASGIGYGYKGRSDWDINKFIEMKKIKINQNIKFMKELDENIKQNVDKSEFKNYILDANLIEIICVFIKQINLVELDINNELYTYIFNILDTINLTDWDDIPTTDLSNIGKALKMFYDESSTFIKINKDLDKTTNKYSIITRSNIYYNKIKNYIIQDNIITNDSKHEYCDILKQYQFDGIQDEFTIHHYKSESFSPNKQCISKISKELSTYHNSLPLNYESSVFLRYSEKNIQLIQVLIIGPENTPYENGCFLFDIYIPDNYPSVPPKVNLQTTGYGKVRFNPNLYNSGKVCLSILGTWSGSEQEKWNKNTSTLLQVLVSIQSLILVENPYFNEPGYEKDMHNKRGKRRSIEYNDLRQKATIEWAMIDMIKKSPKEFKDIIINHFKYKKDAINNTIEKWYNETKLNKTEYNKIKNDMSKLLNNIK